MVITSAVFGLTTVGSAGVAMAADPIGFSPAAKVVFRAPMAVSVTFKEPLRGTGARMRILTDDGDVGTGKVTTGQKTLKRELRLGAPAGKYTVEWNAVSAKGQKMSGSFSFQAARGNGEVKRTSPVPSPPVASPSVASAAPTGPAVSRTPVVTEAAPDPSPTPEVSVSTAATPEWIAGSDPLWTESTDMPSAISADRAGGSGQAGTARGVSTGFTAVPLTVGGLLVLAAGMVSLFNRPRLRG
ncbi:MAG TPA: copper resistance CopC family protein [Kineosporiaceae bacterium]|nr:copper resistance CopC family protein [Kineosporiaceae bacterium]